MERRPRRRDETDEVYAQQMAIDYLVVLPVINYTYADLCIASILNEDGASGFDPNRVLIVDNSRDGFASRRYVSGRDMDMGDTPPAFWNERAMALRAFWNERAMALRLYRDPNGHNLGVARSWNVGAREVLERGLDYLIICSASMQFGPIMHTTFLREVARAHAEVDAHIVEAAGHSWHLIAIHRRCFERVGAFDENLYPAYFEAQDFARRLNLAGLEGPHPGWRTVWVNAVSQAVGGHLDQVACPASPLLYYLYKKWGGAKGEETYTTPWGGGDLAYWPASDIPTLAQRYGLGVGVGWW